MTSFQGLSLPFHWPVPLPMESRLWPGQIKKNDIRLLLNSFENNVTAVRGDVEIANIKIDGQVGNLPFGTRIEVNRPEILMLNIASQEHQGPSAWKEGKVSGSSCQVQGRQRVWGFFRRDRIHWEGGADVWPRVDHESAVGVPHRIDRILANKRCRRTALKGYAEEMRKTMIVG